MLIKVTNFCSMGCSHCMENSTVKGSHMSLDTFERALACTARVEELVYASGLPKHVLLSGGECTEHPDIVKLVETAVGAGFTITLITNGMWLGNQELREALLRPEWSTLTVQVTNDPRVYPTAPPRHEDPRVCYVDQLQTIFPMGRAAGKRRLEQFGMPIKKAPSSFNLRSSTRHYKSIAAAVLMIRARAWAGMASGHCTPSISDNGDIVAGESRECFAFGTVDSSNDELTKALYEMRCNRCGLVDNLSQEQKRAIGESVLYAGGE